MADNNKDKNPGDSLFKGIVLGGVVGFAIGLILAPKSGDETRTLFSERGQELRDKADDLIAAARERMSSVASEGRRGPRSTRDNYPFDDLDLDIDLDDESL
jgi:gas vesicle protein